MEVPELSGAGKVNEIFLLPSALVAESIFGNKMICGFGRSVIIIAR